MTDLDGTLLRSDATLSEYTVKTVSRLLEDGVRISYATARSFLSANKAVSRIPWPCPVVLYNGALLFDPLERKVLGGYWLKEEESNSIIELGRRHGLSPLAFGLTSAEEEAVLHVPLTREGERRFHASRPGDPRFQEMKDLICPSGYKSLILTFIGTLAELVPLHEELKQFSDRVHLHFLEDVYLKGHYFLEVSHAKANKKEGLLQWAARMGIAPSDITVFGDHLNDIGLFEAAGQRFAVSNAHERLKQMAGGILGSQDEDAVARYLEQALR